MKRSADEIGECWYDTHLRKIPAKEKVEWENVYSKTMEKLKVGATKRECYDNPFIELSNIPQPEEETTAPENVKPITSYFKPANNNGTKSQ